MFKDLTNSNIDRQNILNNQYALSEIQKAINMQGIIFEQKIVFIKEQVADFFEVTPRTIDTYIANHENELKQNGYEVLRGKRLSAFKLIAKSMDVNEIGIININTTQLGIFDFRSFLNLIIQNSLTLWKISVIM